LKLQIEYSKNNNNNIAKSRVHHKNAYGEMRSEERDAEGSEPEVGFAHPKAYYY
jgi:hypothetical protein